MSDTVEVSYGTIWKKNSVFNVVIRLFVYGSLDCLSLPRSIIWMNPLLPLFPRKHALFRIEAVNAIPLFGYMQCASFRYVPDPTSGMCELLRFCQITLAAPQRFFRLLCGRDVHHTAHELNGLAGRFDERVTNSVHVSRGPFRQNDSEMGLDTGSRGHCSLEVSDGRASIVRMNMLIKLFEWRYSDPLRNETKQVPVFLGRMDHLSSGNIACPSPGVA